MKKDSLLEFLEVNQATMSKIAKYPMTNASNTAEFMRYGLKSGASLQLNFLKIEKFVFLLLLKQVKNEEDKQVSHILRIEGRRKSNI
jgi:hypothetical protein